MGLSACSFSNDETFNSASCEHFDTQSFSKAEQQEWERRQAAYYQNGQCPSLENFLNWQDNNQDLEQLRKELGIDNDGSTAPAPTSAITKPKTRTTIRTDTQTPTARGGRTRAPQPRLPESLQPRTETEQNYDPAPQKERVEIQPHRRIYRNSESFTGLDTDGRITPGGKYYTDKGNCSFGWTVASDSAPGRIFNLTAGHCGEKGEKVYVAKSGDQPVEIGEFVESFFDSSFQKADYALIEFYPEFQKYIEASPEVSVDSRPLKLAGWKTADWIAANKPYICNLGWRSGLSCGSFRKVLNSYTISYDGIIDHGDSGGVIWAQDPSDPTGQTIYAIAVTSFLTETDATNAGGKLLGPIMDHYDFKIYN